MPSKPRERQYQYQAQRRHEENQRHDFYQRAARYFERESEAAKQFNSWTTRSVESYNKHLEKKRKEEQLQERREELRKLLKDEEEAYKKELEEQERSKSRGRRRRTEENVIKSIEESTCSNFLGTYSASLISEGVRSVDLNSGTASNARPDSGDSQKQTSFSTSLSTAKTSIQSLVVNNSKTMQASNQQSVYNNQNNNLRFAARQSNYAPSLSNTNMREREVDDQCEASSQASEDSDILENQQQKNESRMNKMESRMEQMEMKSESKESTGSVALEKNNASVMETKYRKTKASSPSQKSVSNHDHAPQPTSGYDNVQCAPFDFESFEHGISPNNTRVPENNQISLDNPIGDPDLYYSSKGLRVDDKATMQFYRFLKNNDFNDQILDLCKLEQFALAKQSWDEALRIREMRNEVMLLMSKNLYTNDDIKISDEMKKSAQKLIKMREATAKKRKEMCNYSMYSEEAKDMWKQWVQEDDKFSKLESNATRDLFLNKIEEDWKNLETQDKQRMSELYHHVIDHSELKDEHQLAAAFRNANGRQHRYSDCFEKQHNAA